MTFTGDASLVAKLAALTGLVWATPPRYWRHLAGFGVAPDVRRLDPCAAIYRRALEIEDVGWLSALCAARRISHREAKIQVLGLAGPWRGWRPAICLTGEEHLVASLRRGKGVILWVSSFVYSHLVFKMALQKAGYRATQLSRPAHGFGGSGTAVRILNPIWMRVEERFLKERVLIPGVETGPAIKTLRSRIAANGIVAITVGNEGRHTVEVAFLKHRLRLATGPIYIAQSTGAMLLPAFAVRRADGTFDVIIEAPLSLPPLEAGRERLAEVAGALARRIEPYARRYPEQWGGWNELIPADELMGSGGETA
jgi:predicted LPLAT superfamily acyltransferase